MENVIQKGVPQTRKAFLIREAHFLSFVVLGICFPLSFLAHIDSYLNILSPTEAVCLFAWAFIAHAIVTLLALSILIGMKLIFFQVSRRRDLAIVSLSSRVLAVFLITAVTLTGYVWWATANGEASGLFLTSHKTVLLALVFVTAVGIALHLSQTHIQRMINVAEIGLLLACLAFAFSAVTLYNQASNSTSIAQSTHANTDVDRPNLILISIDALSANHTSLEGYGRKTTPNIDAFATHANVFDNVYSNSNWTTPTTDAIVNGVRPWTAHLENHHARAPANVGAGGMFATLHNAGFQTYVVVTNDYASPFLHRTEPYIDKLQYASSLEYLPPSYWRTFENTFPVLTYVRRVIDVVSVFLGVEGPADHFNPELPISIARAMLMHRDARRPFFLWLHLLPPHDPYAAPPPFVGTFDPGPESRTMFDSSTVYHYLNPPSAQRVARLMNRYDEAIVYTDYNIGLFLSWLRSQSLFDSSVIAITADHGEAFTHNYGGHGGPGLYQDLIHVPLVIKAAHQTAGRRVKGVVDQTDIMPTLLSLEGIAASASAEGHVLSFDGNTPVDADARAFSMNFEQSSKAGRLDRGVIALIQGRWKFISYRGDLTYGLMAKPHNELFDLVSDPEESHNVISENREVAQLMLASIDREVRRHVSP